MDDTGDKAVFQEIGVTYLQKLGREGPTKVPVLHGGNVPYYSPSLVPGEEGMVLHTRWSDTNFISVELANVESEVVHELDGLPLGRYFSPILSGVNSFERRISFVKMGRNLLTGDVVATAFPGLYIGNIAFPPRHGQKPQKIPTRNLRFVPSEIVSDDRLTLSFVKNSNKYYVFGSALGGGEQVWSGPRNATKGLVGCG